MSLELKILPFDSSGLFSNEVLSVKQPECFDAIKALPQLEVEEPVNTYLAYIEEIDRTAYGPTSETPYGEALTYTQAKHLKTVGLIGPVGAYINALQDNVKIALFWC